MPVDTEEVVPRGLEEEEDGFIPEVVTPGISDVVSPVINEVVFSASVVVDSGAS